MRIEYKSNSTTNVSMLEATPGELDGSPAISRLVFPTPTSVISPDRLAVAGALAFGKYISGQILFDEKFSALTAQVMQRFFAPRWIHPTPLHPANLPIPRGSWEVSLGHSTIPVADTNNLLVVPGRAKHGVSYSHNSISIPTNAGLIDAIDSGKSWHSFGARLAVAIIYSEQLDVAILQNKEWIAIDNEEFCNLRELLSACGLGITR